MKRLDNFLNWYYSTSIPIKEIEVIMFKMSEAAAIALHSVIYMANRDGKICTLKEIANKFSISENHLSKVLQRLVKAGALDSIKGPKGGFLIKDKYKNMSFLDVYELIEGKVQQNNCLFHSSHNGCTSCIMNGLVQKLNNEFVEYMKSHKITDFVF